MNSIQRFNAVVKQKPTDKIPVMVSNYNVFLTYYYDISISEYLEDTLANAQCFIQLVKEFDLDVIYPGRGYIFYGCGPETGLEWIFPEGNYPACESGIINSPDDVDKMIIPTEPRGYYKKFLDINQMALEELGEHTLLGIDVLGPFSVAAFFRGFENLLLDMVVNQAFFKQIMERSAAFSLFLARESLKLGFKRKELNEIFIMPEAISPETYFTFLFPHIETVRKVSSPPLIHLEASCIGNPGDRESHKKGQQVYQCIWGTQESIETIRSAPKATIPGFPHFVSLSGNALVSWPLDKIIDFLTKGLDYFVIELGLLPCVHLPSIQATSRSQSQEVADKLKRIDELCRSYLTKTKKRLLFENE